MTLDMDRSDFLKMMGVGAAATVVPFGSKSEPQEKIVSESGEDNLEELYQIMMEGKPFSIGGVEFIMTALNNETNVIEQFGVTNQISISAEIVATGKFT